jgi:hypothetical protein
VPSGGLATVMLVCWHLLVVMGAGVAQYRLMVRVPRGLLEMRSDILRQIRALARLLSSHETGELMSDDQRHTGHQRHVRRGLMRVLAWFAPDRHRHRMFAMNCA